MCGKAHFGPNKSEGADPLNIGFDVNIAGRAIGRPDSYYGEKNYGGVNPKATHAVLGLEKYHGTDTFLTEALTLEINAAITEAVKADKPFFAYMAHYAVHAPFNSDRRFADHYKESGKSNSAQAYATLIEGMDKSLGDILDKLTELGVAENTLVIFLGDNGSDAPLGGAEEYGSSAPLLGKKGAKYEGGMRVPFIVAWAKPSDSSSMQKAFPITHGIIHDEFATIQDILPTLMDLTGLDVPKDHVLDGASMRDILAGKKHVHPQTFLMHFPHKHRSSNFTVYRQKNWKVIWNHKAAEGSDKQYELYDLDKDPYESDNLAASQPERLAAMIKEMEKALQDADALMW
jgi:arylsulfatase A-like enzyme